MKRNLTFFTTIFTAAVNAPRRATAAETNAESEYAVSGVVETATQEATEAAQQLAQGDFSAALHLIEKYVVPLASALALIIASYFVARFLARVVRKPIEKHVDLTLGAFAGRLTFYLIMIFALLGVLGTFGVSVTSFAAVLAAAGFAIGMAFQGTLSNFASGVLLLVFRPYKVGDVINAAGITAKVTEIELFTTVLDTFDNRRIIVPNSQIAGGTIENVTYHTERRVDVAVGVDYAADLDKTRETLEAAARSLKEHLVEGEGRGYQVVLGDLGDSSVNWTVRFWTKADTFFVAKEGLTRAVKNHLDDAGIGIPFPQMDVHLIKEQ